MKKLYLLLVNSLLLLTGVGFLAITVAGCRSHAKAPKKTIIGALNECTTKQTALKINNLNVKQRTWANDPEAKKAIFAALNWRFSNIFTTAVQKEITLDSTKLIPDQPVLVQVTYRVTTVVQIYIWEKISPAFAALKKFSQKNPIVITYNKKNPTALASSSLVTKAIQSRMKSRNPIFTDDVVKDISFSKTPLQPGTAVAVQATYLGEKTTIYVKERNSNVHVALKELTQKNPLKISNLGIDSQAPVSKRSVTTRLQRRLKQFKSTIFTNDVVVKITFDNTSLNPGTAIAVNATYNQQTTKIYVLESKDIDIPNPKQVHDALKVFNDKNPLYIAYSKDDARAPMSESTVTNKVRNTLATRNEVFIPQVVKKITFDNTPLNPGTAVATKVSYHYGEHHIETKIYILEVKQAQPEVYQALKKLTENQPLRIHNLGPKYEYNLVDQSEITKILRRNLKKSEPSIFQDKIISQITFEKSFLNPDVSVPMNAFYLGQSTPIYIKEYDSSTSREEVKWVLHKFELEFDYITIDQKYSEIEQDIYADDVAGSEKIRYALVQQGGLSSSLLASQIYFGHDLITRISKPSEFKWNTEARYYDIKKIIYGKTNKSPL